MSRTPTSGMPDFGEMRRTLRTLARREQNVELPAVQPMYDE
ncbi:hypothetical protein [Halomarina litorea]|nr:hypothetical protein [Halomarina sp. BCD28]